MILTTSSTFRVNKDLFAGLSIFRVALWVSWKPPPTWVVQVAYGCGWRVDLTPSPDLAPRALRSFIISNLLRDAEEYLSWSKSLESKVINVDAEMLNPHFLFCVFLELMASRQRKWPLISRINLFADKRPWERWSSAGGWNILLPSSFSLSLSFPYLKKEVMSSGYPHLPR